MFTQEDLISSYTRRQAIEDGVLVAIDDTLRDAALVLWPSVFTAELWSSLALSHEDIQAGLTIEGRVVALLESFVKTVRALQARNRLTGDLLVFVAQLPGRIESPEVKVVFGPDDNGDPCLTFMFPYED